MVIIERIFMADVEEYFGCDCLCLDHAAQFMYFYPQKDEDRDEDDVIFFTINANHIYDAIIPSFSFNVKYWIYDIGQYFHFHILRRIPIAFKHIKHPYYSRKWGISSTASFQNKNLLKMKEVLSNLTEETTSVGYQNIVYLKNEYWQLRFNVENVGKEYPCTLGWEIQFIPRCLSLRLKSAWNYIFGRHCDEQSFDINKENAAKIKGMIDVIRKINKDEKSS